MADHAARVANEKLKALALMLRNGATLLVAAGIAKWYADGIDAAVFSWLFISTLMTTVGVTMLTLMQPED